MTRTNTHLLALNGVIAAAYAALTYVAAAMNLAYGPVQFRVSEALTVLPFLFPGTWPGLFVGCLVANLMSPYGPLDILIGSAGTLLAAWLTQRTNHPWLAPLPPVLSCMVLTGGMLTWYEVGFSAQFPALFAANALWVGIGEAVVCYLLGMLLLRGLPRVPSLRRYIPEARQGLARARKSRIVAQMVEKQVPVRGGDLLFKEVPGAAPEKRRPGYGAGPPAVPGCPPGPPHRLPAWTRPGRSPR
ncbi:MAG: QueT transporter family protein [Evtepia gabavorous]